MELGIIFCQDRLFDWDFGLPFPEYCFFENSPLLKAARTSQVPLCFESGGDNRCGSYFANGSCSITCIIHDIAVLNYGYDVIFTIQSLPSKKI